VSATSYDCDLAIVGAGPAGCAAALCARQTGLRVILIEKKQQCTKRQPGETLHPGIESLFAQLGVREQIEAEGFHRHRGVWVEWEGPRGFQAYGTDHNGPWKGLQADRARLDALLLDACRAAGTTVLRPCCATGVLGSHDRIAGLVTDAGPIRARWIADASGRRSWLARHVGLRAERHSPPLSVRFGWLNDCRAELDDQPLLQACPGGWDWCAPICGDRLAWVQLRVAGTVSWWSRDLGANTEHSISAAGLDLYWHLVPVSAGDGYFLLGDAAASLDPSSSHGVLHAMMSGILASHLLAAVHRGTLEDSAAAVTYSKWMYAQFHHDALALRRLWERHPCKTTRSAISGSFSDRTPAEMRSQTPTITRPISVRS
jgi:flavin-dependent dehydrogenase